jgi:oxygen-independent coproporphyrinogen III oxidase
LASAPSFVQVTPDLLRKYDRPGPRYTSYPTAVEFGSDYDAAACFESLALAVKRPSDSLSLYVHLPFCEHRCTFCGCNVVITRHREVEQKYLTYLHREIREVARRLQPRRRVVQYNCNYGFTHYSGSPGAGLIRRRKGLGIPHGKFNQPRQ